MLHFWTLWTERKTDTVKKFISILSTSKYLAASINVWELIISSQILNIV